MYQIEFFVFVFIIQRSAFCPAPLRGSAAAIRIRKGCLTQQTGPLQLTLANALWPQAGYPFLPDYLAFLQTFYRTPVTALDFAQAAEAATQLI